MAAAAICCAAQAAPFSVDPQDGGFAILLRGERIAIARGPKSFTDARITRTPAGLSAVARTGRIELALFADRLEYTYEHKLLPPAEPWDLLRLPLAGDDSAEVLYGNTEKPPKTTRLIGRDLTKDATAGIARPRYATITRGGRAFSLDTQPSGCLDDQTDAATPMRTLSCLPVKHGLAIQAARRASYPCTLRAKFIFYADGRGFHIMHPFAIMNYRMAFEKVVRLDFTSAAMPTKKSIPRSVGTQAYTKLVGYGWLGDTSALELGAAKMPASLHREFVSSAQPARFRIDLPPGHYYLTLNIGGVAGPVGPMGITVNGQRRLTDLRVDAGRFKAKLMWITSRQDHLDILFEGSPWQIAALAVSSLGTLDEDFAMTRKWWHLGPQAD